MKIGIDILEIERIKTDEKFLNRILVPCEIEYINKFENKEEHIAGIFSDLDGGKQEKNHG